MGKTEKTILLINGSPHQDGTTASVLSLLVHEFEAAGMNTVRFDLGKEPVRGCIDCQRCKETHRCIFNDDRCNRLIELLLDADGIIVASPVYFSGPNGVLCALLDRAFYALANFGQLLKGKPAASVVTCWRAGSSASLDRLNRYFMFSQMPIISSSYWPQYFGEADSFGKETICKLAQNFTEFLNAQTFVRNR